MKLRESVLCWGPGTTHVKVFRKGTGESMTPRAMEKYPYSGLGAWAHLANAPPPEAKLACFVEAMRLIIRDRCNPTAVHAALMDIDEYREAWVWGNASAIDQAARQAKVRTKP